MDASPLRFCRDCLALAEQEKRVWLGTGHDLGVDAALQLPAVPVGDEIRVQSHGHDVEHGARRLSWIGSNNTQPASASA